MRSRKDKIIHSEYHDSHLVEICDSATRRSLYFDSQHLQSAMSLLNPQELILSYTRFMLFGLLAAPQPAKVLLIGIGSGSFVRYFHHHFPGCTVVGVDYSQHVIDLARGYFTLPEGEDIHIHCMDGQEFIEEEVERGNKYDLILVDAFDSHGMSPSIYSPSCIRQTQAILKESGCISFNLWSSKRRLFAEIQHDIRTTFTGVVTLPIPDRGNVVVIGMNTEVPWEKILLTRKELKELSQKLEIECRLLVKIAKQNNLGLRSKLKKIFH